MKLSPMDLQSRIRWEDYTVAKEKTLLRTTQECAPWFIVKGNDKRRARLNCMKHLVDRLPSEPIKREEVILPDRKFGKQHVSHAENFVDMMVPQVY